MEFLPGGDLMSLLMKEDTFTEDATKQVIHCLVHGSIDFTEFHTWMKILLLDDGRPGWSERKRVMCSMDTGYFFWN